MKKCECGNEKFITVSTIYVDRNLAKDKFFFQYLPNCEKKLENEDYLCNRAS